jgi:ABC-type Fe3+/spermidine/putrescine transport system ATPase subunit
LRNRFDIGTMAFLELKRVSKGYRSNGTLTPVLRDINLSIEKGEFVAIVGYSGSGKTTLISLIAGLIRPDTGTVTLDGAEITGPSPERGIVFQNYSLLPWLTTYENGLPGGGPGVSELVGRPETGSRGEVHRDGQSVAGAGQTPG